MEGKRAEEIGAKALHGGGEVKRWGDGLQGSRGDAHRAVRWGECGESRVERVDAVKRGSDSAANGAATKERVRLGLPISHSEENWKHTEDRASRACHGEKRSDEAIHRAGSPRPRPSGSR